MIPDIELPRRLGFPQIAAGSAAIIAGALSLPNDASAQRMQGFDPVAAAEETVELRVPTWMRGSIRLDGRIVGSVRRRAMGRSRARQLFGVSVGDAARYGTFAYDVADTVFGGRLSVDCVYGRKEGRVEAGSSRISAPLWPLQLQCRFLREDREVGRMLLEAPPPSAAIVQSSERFGVVNLDGVTLRIESAHRLRGAAFSTDWPVGYRFRAGRTLVGTLDLTGFSRCFVTVPPGGGGRLASLLAATTLAVFWDPGNTDD